MTPQSIHEDGMKARIQELEAEVRALRDSEVRYRGILENMELGIMEVDTEERVLRAHPRFCEIVGYSEAELLGQKASDVLLDVDARAAMDARTAARNAGDSGLYETPIRTRSGETKWLLISAVPTVDADGNITGSMGIHYDITERKRDEQRMEETMAEAERARLAEREFLAKMSHEIRTPMTAILGMIRLLGETELTEEQRGLWKAMQGGGDVLKRLLDGVLNLTRLDAGRMEVREENVGLSALVSGVVSPFRSALEEKSIALVLDLPPEEAEVRMDGALLTQVILNLLGNAVKFTDEGEVRVGAALVEARDKTALELTVEDTGIGIPASDLDAVFGRFKQASNREYRHPGSGLGLSIVRDILALVGGTVEVDSEVGKGTRFTVLWPTSRIQPSGTAGEEAHASPVKRIAGRFLVAEDNEINAFLLRSLLEKWGGEVVVVDNGEQALEAWRNEHFDLICMDVQMPVRDGMWATARIREEEQGRIPILGLSAFAFDADKEAALASGMDGYLTKPFDPSELWERLGALLA